MSGVNGKNSTCVLCLYFSIHPLFLKLRKFSRRKSDTKLSKFLNLNKALLLLFKPKLIVSFNTTKYICQNKFKNFKKIQEEILTHHHISSRRQFGCKSVKYCNKDESISMSQSISFDFDICHIFFPT